MTESAYERLLSAIESSGRVVKHGGRGDAMAQCPAHEDGRPSLHVTAIEGSVLLHCHAGCTADEVTAAVGLTAADLFDDRHGARYDYGARTVFRGPRKTFRQAGDTRDRSLFRAGNVRAAVAAGRPVFVVEGEKDVLAIESAGGVATCNAGGAGKWRMFDDSPLHGGDITVVVDQDEPGHRHALDVAKHLDGKAKSLRFVKARTGKDAADHVAAGHPLGDFVPVELGSPKRRLVLTRASQIRARRVRWLWTGRIPLGFLSLVGGPEGLGKSTLVYQLAADVTRGLVPGELEGHPAAVLIVSTEDSWAEVIVPRLMAAGADLDRVYQVQAHTDGDLLAGVDLEVDLSELETAARDLGAALLVLDPLMSRISGRLDTHKDADVRKALEPLAAMLERSKVAAVGLIHLNKSSSTAVLDRIMGSKAFAAVARSVSVCMWDPEDTDRQRRLFGTPKSNLGATTTQSLAFVIDSTTIRTDDGDTSVGRVRWVASSDLSIADALESAVDSERAQMLAEAKAWLTNYMQAVDPDTGVPSADVKRAAREAGIADATLTRARMRLAIGFRSEGFPKVTRWFPPVRSGGDLTEPPPDQGNGPFSGTAGPVDSEGPVSFRDSTDDLTGSSSEKRTYGVGGSDVVDSQSVHELSPRARTRARNTPARCHCGGIAEPGTRTCWRHT